MRRPIALLLASSLAFAAVPAAAQVEEVNPNYTMSIVGDDTFMAPAGTVLADRFTVRIVDRAGEPVPDLVVWFYPNCPVGIPENPLPPCFKGRFVGVEPSDLAEIPTDADGVAVAPPYEVGGIVDVVAGAYGWGDGSANDVIGWPPLVEYFHVNHQAGAPPPPDPVVEQPGGSVAAVAAPASSAWALAALAALLALSVSARRRRAR